MTRTKIVCTIGPAVNTLEKITQLIYEGMSVARLNFSHGNHEEHARVIELLKQARALTKKPLAILLDTKGPEIRLGKIAEPAWHVRKGEEVYLVDSELAAGNRSVALYPKDLFQLITPGHQILFDDGHIASKVIEVSPHKITVEIENDGFLSSNKGVNIPDCAVDFPVITDSDIADIRFGCEQGIDIIAASFICSAEHVLMIKELLQKFQSEHVQVIAKIENRQGIENLEKIISVSDGIMIARGDLGVEVPLEQVPRLQKLIIKKCIFAGKTVITATQMLESMIHKPRPTRAEVSDVANAIYDSSCAVMLSGETAKGNYPIMALKTMTTVVKEAEKDFNYHRFLANHIDSFQNDPSSAIALAAVKTAYNISAKAIFISSGSGEVSKFISRLRPSIPIIAMTSSLQAYNQMGIIWGVTPFFDMETSDCEKCFEKLAQYALEKETAQIGDVIVFVTGSSFGVRGSANSLTIKCIEHLYD